MAETSATAVIAAVAALVSATVTAVLTYVSARRNEASQSRLEETKSLLAQVSGDRTARQAYEYEARKHLYVQAEPLLFQFYENANYALNRIRNLARAAREGKLPDWLCGSDPYYLRSTMHSFLVPLASIYLLRERLTTLDLTLDPRIERLYELGKAINRSFNRDFFFAAEAPQLGYGSGEQPQGIVGGEVQRAIDCVLRPDAASVRIKAFWEFSNDLEDPESPASKGVQAFSRPWMGFSPSKRPVFWRIVMAQLFLYRAVRLHRQGDISEVELLAKAALTEEEKLEFSFTTAASDAIEVDAAFKIGFSFLQKSLQYQNPLNVT